MTRSNSSERQDGNNLLRTKRPRRKSSYLRPEGLDMTGFELEVIKVAGLLITSKNEGNTTSKFLRTADIQRVRGALYGDRSYVQFEFYNPGQGPTSATLWSKNSRFRLLFQAH